ncbi:MULTISPECIES: butyrate kinase [unclassified Sedimentibacter]|uniref:butyrate kinase n=1 Tax=unclassified Sedimentibacter TaxID=2649220 RepID=UPI0027E13B58|nr:butyrate kinase [Sedimentibacter sp. MB35-C1]WMJ77730.1 butyrate kinase [Sedimentibacter sp. MB35-C1]
MKKSYKILAINPGSTSTKIALYENKNVIYKETVSHMSSDLEKFNKISDQFEFRKNIILTILKEQHIDLSELDAIVGRGGNMKPVEGGTYQVNEEMVRDLKIGIMGQHASNLGGIIADSIAKDLKISAYVVDPVVVDEFEDYARISGIPEIKRKSKSHPLNQKAVARLAASELGGEYSSFNFIVAHMGGGISIGAHKKGKIVDVNNCLDGEGTFSPERSGGLPVGSLVELCFSGNYTIEEIKKKITGKGGLVAYLGTNDAREVKKKIAEGDNYSKLIYETMAYQIAKDIGAAATVLKGKIDSIVLTGGLAYDEELVRWIKERVSFIAPIKVYPGENEMQSMVQGVIRVLNGDEKLKIYS